MRTLLPALALACSISPTISQQTPSASPLPAAAEIMAKVALNQDRSEAERIHYLYVQHARVASRKGKTVRCEEITDSRVIPSDSGSHQQLLKLEGRLLTKNKYITYDQLPVRKDSGSTSVNVDSDDLRISIGTEESTDRELVEGMRKSLTGSHSKDGIGAGLFPLTSKTQDAYTFKLLGLERMNGREVFHITFVPKEKNDFGWKGDAYIDVSAYQPVLVRTDMARKIPFAVRTLLGTSLPGLGFTVVYAPQPQNQPDGLWFPVSFGTEFKLHLLFFFSREITLSAENRDFQQTHVQSTIISEASPAQP